MPQIFNPSSSLDEQQSTNLAPVQVTATIPPRNEFIPTRKLKNSVASQSPFGDPNNNFEALAADIPDAFATYEQPKLKFLFTVQFVPRDGLSLPLNNQSETDMDSMFYALKRATRPNPTITYQDINFYGFRTKVGTKTDYGTVTLTFYDDVVNRTHSLVTQYLKLVSPIFNKTIDDADNLAGTLDNARSFGALNNKMGPFKYMRVTHYMLDNNDPASGQPKQVSYDYLNPKIVNVNFDELDMTQSDVSNIEITFVYDSVSIKYSDQVDANPNTTDNSNNPITKGITSSSNVNSGIVANGFGNGIGGFNQGNDFDVF